MSDQSVWDRLWAHASVQDWDNLSAEILRALLAEIGSPSGLKILEAGCGTGRVSARLAMAGASARLLDYSQEALDTSSRVFAAMGLKPEVARGDIRNMPYDDGEFDVAWSGGVLEHYDFPTQVRMLDEMVRVTKDGGLVISIVPFAGSPFYRLGKWWAERSGTRQYGEENPMWTFSAHEPHLKGHILKEYSIARSTSLDFLDCVPGGSPVAKQFRLELALDPGLQECVPGYLLVSALKVDKSKKVLDEPAPKNRDNVPLPTILCLSSIDWSFLKQRPQQMMLKLRDLGHKIVYIDWKRHELTTSDLGALWKQAVPEGRSPLPADGSVWDFPDDPAARATLGRVFESCATSLISEAEPGIIQVRWVGSIKDAEERYATVDSAFLDWLMRFLDLRDCVAWIVTPIWWRLVSDRKDFGLVVYDCVDETAMPNTPFANLEATLTKACDIVFATARSIARNRRGDTSSVFYLPNGVERALFETAAPEPDDIKRIPRPRIGFVGAISGWVDVDLLLRVAAEHPDWSVVLIGPAYTVPPDVKSANVYQLGPKPYDQIPAYYRALDVGVIPFKENDTMARNSNPIKAYEYLAAKVPVVSTRIPELEQFGAVFKIGDGFGGFTSAVEEVLRDGKAVTESDDALRLLETVEWLNLARVSSGLLRAVLEAKRGHYGLAASLAAGVLERAHDKAAVHGFIRQTRRLERAAKYVRDGSPLPVPLRIAGKLPYCILLYPDWEDPEGAWADALTLLASLYESSERITLAVRTDPNRIPLERAIMQVGAVLSKAGIDPIGMNNLVLVNDALSGMEEDRLLLAADAVVIPGKRPKDGREDLPAKAISLGVTLVDITGVGRDAGRQSIAFRFPNAF